MSNPPRNDPAANVTVTPEAVQRAAAHNQVGDASDPLVQHIMGSVNPALDEALEDLPPEQARRFAAFQARDESGRPKAGVNAAGAPPWLRTALGKLVQTAVAIFVQDVLPNVLPPQAPAESERPSPPAPARA